MKQTKKHPLKKAKKPLTKKSSKRLNLAHQSSPILRSFRLLETKYSGKIVSRKNTSHVSLLLVLIFLGFFLFTMVDLTSAFTTQGRVNIGLTVPGPAPTVGATITYPVDNQEFFDNNVIVVTGVCQIDTFVVIKTGDIIIGSTDCGQDGTFSVSAQIEYGHNVLTAMNFDYINQSGPVTPAVNVSLSKTVSQVTEPKSDYKPSTANDGLMISNKPVSLDSPFILPNQEKNCSNYSVGELSTGGEPRAEIVCVPQFFFPGIEQTLGILVWGGEPPYAVSVDFSDYSSPKLISINAPGYKTLSFSYAQPNTYKIKLRMTDHQSKISIAETSVKASGVVFEYNDNKNIIEEIAGVEWFNTPVPFYLLAVAVTLGFWGGDLFDRNFGERVINKKFVKK